MKTSTHSFFLLNFNSWPIMSSIMSFNTFFGLILLFKFSSNFMFLLSLFVMVVSSFTWWINYKNEFNFLGLSSMSLEVGIKMSMLLFISSEVFFFFSFFWSYFHFFLSPGMESGFNWPPVGLESFKSENVPFLNTLILLFSGVTATLSHFFLNTSKKKMFHFFLFFTILLGMVFTLFQLVEYKSSFFSISDSSFGTSFFMLTGFHGIHVIVGTIFLMSVLFFSFFINSSSENFLSFDLACWYWHFVDVVWIFLFFFLYYINDL